MCDCRARIDADLESRNARLAFGFMVDANQLSVSAPMIMTEKVKPRGKKPPIILASYCPFCGVKFP